MRNGTIVNEEVIDEEVLLDGSFILNSILRNCKLTFRGEKSWQLKNSKLINCKWALGGPAFLTVEFLKDLYTTGGDMQKSVERLIGYIKGKTGWEVKM